MTHMASTCHTLKDTKEAYIGAVSVKLGGFASDAREAIQQETLIVFLNPVRLQLQLPSLLKQQESILPSSSRYLDLYLC